METIAKVFISNQTITICVIPTIGFIYIRKRHFVFVKVCQETLRLKSQPLKLRLLFNSRTFMQETANILHF